jgi:predicted kinase
MTIGPLGSTAPVIASPGPRYGAAVTASIAAPALVVCGAPASGKSTLGRALAARLGAAILDQDVLTAPLVAVVSAHLGSADLDSPELAGATRAARYETLTAGAEDNLRTGRPVVLVAPFSAERRDPEAWARLASRLDRAGGAATLVWLRLTGEQLLTRMRDRGAERDQAKLVDGAAYLARIDLTAPAVPHVAVDASDGVDQQCARVLAELS